MVYYFKKISPRLLHSTSNGLNRFLVGIVAAHVFVTDVTALCRGGGSPPNPTSHWIGGSIVSDTIVYCSL